MRGISTHILLVLALGFSAGAYGQDARQIGRISVAEILERSLIATGGLEAHQKLRSFAADGNFGFSLSHPLGYYKFTYRTSSTDMLEVQLISHGISWSGRRDQELIQRGTVEGAGMINGAGIRIVEEDWRSLLEWDFSHEYKRIELIGRAQVGRKWTYALKFTPQKGDACMRFYDEQTFLLLRMDQVQRFRTSKDQPETGDVVESYFRDYDDRGGVKLPRTIVISRLQGELQFDVANVRPNAKIDDSMFK